MTKHKKYAELSVEEKKKSCKNTIFVLAVSMLPQVVTFYNFFIKKDPTLSVWLVAVAAFLDFLIIIGIIFVFRKLKKIG